MRCPLRKSNLFRAKGYKARATLLSVRVQILPGFQVAVSEQRLKMTCRPQQNCPLDASSVVSTFLPLSAVMSGSNVQRLFKTAV